MLLAVGILIVCSVTAVVQKMFSKLPRLFCLCKKRAGEVWMDGLPREVMLLSRGLGQVARRQRRTLMGVGGPY